MARKHARGSVPCGGTGAPEPDRLGQQIGQQIKLPHQGLQPASPKLLVEKIPSSTSPPSGRAPLICEHCGQTLPSNLFPGIDRKLREVGKEIRASKGGPGVSTAYVLRNIYGTMNERRLSISQRRRA